MKTPKNLLTKTKAESILNMKIRLFHRKNVDASVYKNRKTMIHPRVTTAVAYSKDEEERVMGASDAFCSPKDQDNRKLGNHIALSRLIKLINDKA